MDTNDDSALKVAIQGQAASFHDVAARQYFSGAIDIIPCELPFRLVFNSLRDGQAEYAVCAIENSLYGPINEVYDLLLEYRPWICGEVYLRIEQCLIGLPGASLDDITEVYSHPVALSQCEDFLDGGLAHAKRHELHDTAFSVSEVARWGDKSKAAIASAAAAELHGLVVIKRGIETNRQNYTRFVVMQAKQQNDGPTDKTSVVVSTPHQAGSLYKVLGVFARYDINLLLITSRPIVGRAQAYMFYLDFAAGAGEPRTGQALGELEAMGCEVTVLGSYKSAELPKN